jgi:hypothetical protein
MKLVSRSRFWLALKILFFPAIIILAVNIENLATKFGLSFILADHAGTIMADILEIVRSAWVQMPALLIVGGSVALWLDHLLRREEVALIEAQAELAKQNRLAEKGNRSSPAIDNSSPQPGLANDASLRNYRHRQAGQPVDVRIREERHVGQNPANQLQAQWAEGRV